MTTAPMVRKTGPRTFPAAELILGGQLVEARAAGLVGVAGAGSAKVLGVAITDAVAGTVDQSAAGTTLTGQPVTNASPVPTFVSVAYGDVEVPVTYSGAAAFGDKLVATANGRVAPAGATPTAGTIVGQCVEPLGVAANAVGLTRIV